MMEQSNLEKAFKLSKVLKKNSWVMKHITLTPIGFSAHIEIGPRRYYFSYSKSGFMTVYEYGNLKERTERMELFDENKVIELLR